MYLWKRSSSLSQNKFDRLLLYKSVPIIITSRTNHFTKASSIIKKFHQKRENLCLKQVQQETNDIHFYVNLSVKIFNLKMNHGSGREKKKEEKIFTLFRHKIWHKLVQVNMIRDKLKKMNLKIEKKIIYWTGSVMIMNFDSSSPFKYPVRHSSVVGGVFCWILQGVSAFWNFKSVTVHKSTLLIRKNEIFKTNRGDRKSTRLNSSH